MTARAERKRAELGAKLMGLEAELDAWEESSAADGPLERHHTQIRALTRLLRGPLEAQRQRVAGLSTTVGSWADIEQGVLRIHGIWDFFRQKFALRDVEWFRPYLMLADEFAWNCYQPVRARCITAPEQLRQPPLVYLGQTAAPFALPRGSPYAAALPPEVLTADDLRGLAEQLPVPLIAVPWYQLHHLPDALVLGHEVGHVVETDFGLTETLQTALRDAGLAAPWPGWQAEVFADVFGVLAGGPGFACALADFIPTGAAASIGTTGYPPTGIRIAVVAAALASTGFGDEGESLLERWRADFPDDVRPEAQAEAAAEALLSAELPSLGGAKLLELISFGSRRKLAAAAASALRDNVALDKSIDARTLLSAAALAFTDSPEQYLRDERGQAVLDHAHQAATAGVRATPPPMLAEEDDERAERFLGALMAR